LSDSSSNIIKYYSIWFWPFMVWFIGHKMSLVWMWKVIRWSVLLL